MKLFVRATCLAMLSSTLIPSAAVADGLMEAAPNDAYLAIYSKHNPERDYQNAYYADIRQTVEDTKIVDKFFAAIQKQVPPDQFAQFEMIKNQLLQAVSPIDWDAAMDCSESLYIQTMEIPTTHHLVMAKMADGGAASVVEGLTNLLKFVEAASQGQVGMKESEIGGIQMFGLELPADVPFNPIFGATDDGMFVFTSSPRLMEQCMALLADPSAASKFDDPRVATALKVLPQWEDSIVFFDGKKLFSELKGMRAFIEGVGAGNEEATRIAELMGTVFNEVDIADFELTVEYTDGYQNRAATYGAMRGGYQETAVGKMFVNQEKFDNWSSWVPESATSWSLNSGATLAPLYTFLMEVIPQTFPEAEQGIAQFEAIQDQYDVHLYDDILTAFSGESVSVSFPGPPSPFGGPTAKSATFLKCDKPERVQELIQRGFDIVLEIPAVKKQGVTLTPVDGMEGFQQLNVSFFAMLNVKPVFGFKDGWMVLASHADAVQTIELARGGEAATVETSEKFTAFSLPIEGPINSTSYVNTGQQTRDFAQGLQSIGTMLPMMMAMAGGGNNGPDLSKASDFLNLLPDLGRIVAKFDFLDSTLSMSKPGPTDGTYIRESVTLIKPPANTSH